MSKIKNLVIVESPFKIHSIEKYLGSDYKVMSSVGHIRDLQKKHSGIDIENGFTPLYEVPEDKKDLVEKLKKAASEADKVWLATDEDREGEAIAWHLYEVLGLKPENTKRIVFHEITEPALKEAIAHPREIDKSLVDAQQARRVLDRLVGFELSPVLWKKIKPALSAGRVQSVAVRLIVERENEIKNFKSEPYYRITAVIDDGKGNKFRAELGHRLADNVAAKVFLEKCKGAEYEIGEVTVKPMKKSPAPPFTTSTLQQEAVRKLGFTVSQTMMVAQRLYENGHITYMRTDSLNLSEVALKDLSKLIKTKLGENYLKIRHYHTNSKGAQEAHEAIRPTYPEKTTIDGTAQEKRLYELIRKRTIASQIADAELEKTTIDIEIKPATNAQTDTEKNQDKLSAYGETIKFPGFLKVYSEDAEEGASAGTISSFGAQILPQLEAGQKVNAEEVTATQRFTQHPSRYKENDLVKKMEELGIGRPSTYATTISTIQQREYVEKGTSEGEPRDIEILTLKNGKITSKTKTEKTDSEKGKLMPTDIGVVVNDFLTEYFPEILDYNFTAKVESQFDLIAQGELQWNSGIANFYKVFHPEIERTLNLQLEHKVGERQLGLDPKTGQPVTVKIGRYGPLVQIGDTNSDERPKFSPLRPGQSVSTITLEDALKLFEYPRAIGEYEGKEVSVNVGRFGPYVKHDGKFVSIPKDLSPETIDLDEAIELIKAKAEAEKKKIVKIYDEDPELHLLNGRYGIYLAYKGQNYKIPKTVADPASLKYEEAKKIVEDEANKPAKDRKGTARKATAKAPAKTASKATATKTTAKTSATKTKAKAPAKEATSKTAKGAK